MGANTTVVIESNLSTNPITANAKARSANAISRKMLALASGAEGGTVRCLASATKASATVTVAGSVAATQTVTVTINGVAFSKSAASAALVVSGLTTDINASTNALISGRVVASNVGTGVLTITAVNAGKDGNGFTLSASATGGSVLTASGARLTGGANTAASGTLTLGGTIVGSTFSAIINGTTISVAGDTDAGTTGTALKTAINANGTVNPLVLATDNGAGVVTVTAKRSGLAGNAISFAGSVTAGTSLTVSGARLTGGAGTKASGTATFAAQDASGETITINVGGTAVASPGQADAAAQAIRARDDINGDPVASLLVTATADTGVLTLTAKEPGTWGNGIAWSTSATGGKTPPTLSPLTKLGSGAETKATGTIQVATNLEAETGSITINGVAIPFTTGASKILTAAAINTAIGASVNPLVQGHVTSATDGVDTVTVTAVDIGIAGNDITLAGAVTSAGTNTASGSGKLASGAETNATGTIVVTTNVAGETLTATVNGVAITATSGASKAATALALQGAIAGSVNALVADQVTATQDGVDTVTLTAKNLGTDGNAITLAASGASTATATASTARLASGSETLSTFTFP